MFFNLIRNEWEKIFRQKTTFLMIALLIFGVMVLGGVTKYLENNAKSPNVNWKQELIAENEALQKEAEDIQMMTPSMKEYLHKQQAINEYRLKNDLPPEQAGNAWTFINDSVSLIPFAGLFVLIIAAGIVANEFTWGTVKILLLKPYKRWKVLLSKYVAVIIFLVFMLAVLFASAWAVGAVLFGFGDLSGNIHLSFVNGRVVEEHHLFYLIQTYVFKSLSVLLLATMAFMISAVLRNSGLAIGLSVFLLVIGGTVTNLLASKFEWAKYSLFANTDLSQYIDGLPVVDSMTMKFSIIILLVYFLFFHILAFFFFTKRDISS